MPVDSVNTSNKKGVGTLKEKPEPLRQIPESSQKQDQLKPEASSSEKEKARELQKTQREDTKKEKGVAAKNPAAQPAKKVGGKAVGKLKEGATGFLGVYGLAFILAIINDLLDYIGFIGSIPLLGDIVDVGISGTLWVLIGGTPALLSLIELIPFVDILPTYTIIVLFSFMSESFKKVSK